MAKILSIFIGIISLTGIIQRWETHPPKFPKPLGWGALIRDVMMFVALLSFGVAFFVELLRYHGTGGTGGAFGFVFGFFGVLCG